MAMELTVLAEEATALDQHQLALLLTNAAAEASRAANLISHEGSPAESA